MVNISSYNDITQDWNNKLNLQGLISGCGHRASLSATFHAFHTDHIHCLVTPLPAGRLMQQDPLLPHQPGSGRRPSFFCLCSPLVFPYLPLVLLQLLVCFPPSSSPPPPGDSTSWFRSRVSNFSQSFLSAFPSSPASFLCDQAAEQLSIPRQNSQFSTTHTAEQFSITGPDLPLSCPEL